MVPSKGTVEEDERGRHNDDWVEMRDGSFNMENMGGGHVVRFVLPRGKKNVRPSSNSALSAETGKVISIFLREPDHRNGSDTLAFLNADRLPHFQEPAKTLPAGIG